MENFDDFEKKNYRKAEVKEWQLYDYFLYLTKLLIHGGKIFILILQEIFENLLNSNKSKDIRGQLALVTGGANGLGREISKMLAKEGCDVVIIDVNISEAEEAAKEIREKFNVKSKAYKVDVSDFKAIKSLQVEIKKDFHDQSVDILVNNAGILSAISLTEGHYSQIQKVIDVNLTQHFWTVRTFLPDMIAKKRGHIVGIASLGGKITFPCAISYCATKFGVDGFYRALADELCVDDSDEFIKTLCVFPSFINTRRELTEILDQMDGVGPRMSASYVANEIVKALKKNKTNLVLPFNARILQLSNFLPPKAMKFAKMPFIPAVRRKVVK